MDEKRLAEIERLCGHNKFAYTKDEEIDLSEDCLELIAEVRRLRSENTVSLGGAEPRAWAAKETCCGISIMRDDTIPEGVVEFRESGSDRVLGRIINVEHYPV